LRHRIRGAVVTVEGCRAQPDASSSRHGETASGPTWAFRHLSPAGDVRILRAWRQGPALQDR